MGNFNLRSFNHIRWAWILYISCLAALNCAHQPLPDPDTALAEAIPYQFTLKLHREKGMYPPLDMEGKGKVFSPDSFEVEGLSGIDPHRLLLALTGKRDWKKEKEGVYKFTANLYLLDPVKGEGEGIITIHPDGFVVEGKKNGMWIKMEIKPLPEPEYVVSGDSVLAGRIECMGRKVVEIKKGKVRYRGREIKNIELLSGKPPVLVNVKWKGEGNPVCLEDNPAVCVYVVDTLPLPPDTAYITTDPMGKTAVVVVHHGFKDYAGIIFKGKLIAISPVNNKKVFFSLGKDISPVINALLLRP